MAHIRVYLNDVLLDQVEFDEGKLTIGRSSDCDLVIDNAGVSSMHAVIEKTGNSFVISDNDSTNGVYVNGDKVDQHTLKFWDEIQLYNYILKFMSTAGLEDSDDPDIAKDSKDNEEDLDKTMEVDLSNVQDLLKLREHKKAAYLEIDNSGDGGSRVTLEGTNFTIGRSKKADLRTSGWFFSPAISAEIQKQADGYYLVTYSSGHTQINGRYPAEEAKLADGDTLTIRNISATFNHRL